MKKILFFITLAIGTASCGDTNQIKAEEANATEQAAPEDLKTLENTLQVQETVEAANSKADSILNSL